MGRYSSTWRVHKNTYAHTTIWRHRDIWDLHRITLLPLWLCIQSCLLSAYPYIEPHADNTSEDIRPEHPLVSWGLLFYFEMFKNVFFYILLPGRTLRCEQQSISTTWQVRRWCTQVIKKIALRSNCQSQWLHFGWLTRCSMTQPNTSVF